MPQKSNPIYFENAEGNLYIARALLGVLADKLPVSRLQRDLSDSTMMKNVGVALGHLLIALDGIHSGLCNIDLNEHSIQWDVARHPDSQAESIQTILRSCGYDRAYEFVKEIITNIHWVKFDVDTFRREIRNVYRENGKISEEDCRSVIEKITEIKKKH